jgi:hypothetical protein
MQTPAERAITWPVILTPNHLGGTAVQCGLCKRPMAIVMPDDPPEAFSAQALAIAVALHLRSSPVHSVTQQLARVG